MLSLVFEGFPRKGFLVVRLKTSTELDAKRKEHGVYAVWSCGVIFWTWGVLKSSCGVLVLVMGRFAAVPGGAASPLPDSPPHGQRGRCPSRVAKSCAKLLADGVTKSCAKLLADAWLNPAQSSLEMVWLNFARSSQSQFQETIVPRVGIVLRVSA